MHLADIVNENNRSLLLRHLHKPLKKREQLLWKRSSQSCLKALVVLETITKRTVAMRFFSCDLISSKRNKFFDKNDACIVEKFLWSARQVTRHKNAILVGFLADFTAPWVLFQIKMSEKWAFLDLFSSYLNRLNGQLQIRAIPILFRRIKVKEWTYAEVILAKYRQYFAFSFCKKFPGCKEVLWRFFMLHGSYSKNIHTLHLNLLSRVDLTWKSYTVQFMGHTLPYKKNS